MSLEFSLGAYEIWGAHSHVDFKVEYSMHLLEEHNLCDVDLIKKNQHGEIGTWEIP